MLLLPALSAQACPSCTYDRLLAEHWHIKYLAVSFVIPMLVVANRLDLVRFTFVLIPYVAFAFYAHNYLFWHTFPGDTLIAQVAWWIWGLNLFGVVLFYAISRWRYFRWKQDRGLAVWQLVAYSLAMVLAQIVIA